MNISVVFIVSTDNVFWCHHSIRSLKRALDYSAADDISYEVIFVLNNTGEETEKYIGQVNFFENFSIFKTSFSHKFECRNFGVSKAVGKYITFLDSANLMSEKWIKNSFDMLERVDFAAIAHPKCEVCFDGQYCIIVNENSSNLMDFALLSGNAYSEECFAPRHILQSFPYEASDRRYDDPYWNFNGAVSNNLIRHICTDESIFFVRIAYSRKKNIRWLSEQQTDHILNKKSFPLYNIDQPHFNYNIFRVVAILKHPIFLFKKDKRKILSKYANETVFKVNFKNSSWLFDEIVSINSIEPIIQSWKYKSHYKKIICSQAYVKCSFFVSHALLSILRKYRSADVCAFVPFFGVGGAEKVGMQYICKLNKLFSGNLITFATDSINNNKKQVFFDVEMIDISKSLKLIGIGWQRARTLAQILEILHPKIVYFYNSNEFYKVFQQYGSFISKITRIYCSLFALSYTEKTKELWWIVVDNIESAYPYITKIITDNKTVIKQLTDMLGFNPKKMICNYTPVRVNDVVPFFERANHLNVFWASRICREKRLDVLLKIVQALKGLPVVFHVFGSPRFRYSNVYFNRLRWCRNVKCYGSYNGFQSIADNRFDVFLYTSESDGIPNVILEAFSFGYSVIAPNVGGISEIVNENTGFLIEDYMDHKAYVEVLKEILYNRSILKNKQPCIKSVLETNFRDDIFERNVELIIQ